MMRCSHCGNDFAPSEYQVRKREYRCPDCRKRYFKNYRADRRSAGNPIISTKMPREYHTAYDRKYRQRPEVKIKESARSKARAAVSAGKITPEPCEVCGNVNVEAHHDDYSKPLAVRWFCRRHHTDYHLANDKEKGGA